MGLRLRSKIQRRHQDVREFFIRGRRGWAPTDVWNLDDYLARVIGESLQTLAEHGGFPEGWEPEVWQAHLNKQARALLGYAELVPWNADWEHEKVVVKRARKALRRLAKDWGHLWY